VLEEVGAHDAVVDDGRSLQGGHAPHEEGTLSEPVERDPPDDAVGEKLDDGEEGKDGPVHQPLGVVRLSGRLERLDGPVGGIEESDKVAEQLCAVTEHEPDDAESDDPIGDVGLLDLGLVLSGGEDVADDARLVDKLFELSLVVSYRGRHLERDEGLVVKVGVKGWSERLNKEGLREGETPRQERAITTVTALLPCRPALISP
jgi:hypothetical protein